MDKVNPIILDDAIDAVKEERITKTKKVLEHLQTHGTLTSWEAIDLYGETRLAAKVFELRKHHDIESERKVGIDRYGNLSHFVEYRYLGELED